MSKPILAWSHSACEAFMTCPLKFYETRITKNFKEEQNASSDWGNKVHAALKRYVTLGAELPANMVQYKRMADKVLHLARVAGLTVFAELQLAVDEHLQPCAWKDWENCWMRCALDVLLVQKDNPLAVAVDWKTGKVKENDNQLALQAATVFRHYPQVMEVKSMFAWLVPGTWATATFTRQHEAKLWRQYLPVVRQMTEAVADGNWPASPSGLCREYCPVTTCRHNGGFRK